MGKLAVKLKNLLGSGEGAAPLSSVDAYAQWAAHYPPHAHNALMQAEEACMLALLPDMIGQTVLDLAGGTGRYGHIAIQRGAARVICTDNSIDMLAHNALETRIGADMDALPLRQACADGIICALAIGHLKRVGAALREIARVLRPGGWALVSDFHPYAYMNGARRTFTGSDGRAREVEHYVHALSGVISAGHDAGLRLEAVREPGVPDAVAPPAMRGKPVVVAYRFAKP